MTENAVETAAALRVALSDLELAVQSLGLVQLVEGWGEPRHEGRIGVTLKTNAKRVYQIHDALVRAARLLNGEARHDR